MNFPKEIVLLVAFKTKVDIKRSNKTIASTFDGKKI